MSAHTGELLSGTPIPTPLPHYLDSEGCLAEVGAASSSTTSGQCWRSYGLVCWYAGVLGHFDVDFSGRLFEVSLVPLRCEALLVVFVLRVWCLLRVLFLAHSFLRCIHSMFLSA